LINADSEYRVAANLAGSIPHRVLDLPITIKLPADARVEQVSLLRAVPEAAHSPIAFQEEGERVSVQVPEVRIWSVVVVDYEANQGVEAAKADL
jgi:methyl coenzyme M reductase beta subunit